MGIQQHLSLAINNTISIVRIIIVFYFYSCIDTLINYNILNWIFFKNLNRSMFCVQADILHGFPCPTSGAQCQANRASTNWRWPPPRNPPTLAVATACAKSWRCTSWYRAPDTSNWISLLRGTPPISSWGMSRCRLPKKPSRKRRIAWRILWPVTRPLRRIINCVRCNIFFLNLPRLFLLVFFF